MSHQVIYTITHTTMNSAAETLTQVIVRIDIMRLLCSVYISRLWIEETKELDVFVTEISWNLKGLVAIAIAIAIATAVRKKSLAAAAPAIWFSKTPPGRERELDRCSRLPPPPALGLHDGGCVGLLPLPVDLCPLLLPTRHHRQDFWNFLQHFKKKIEQISFF